MQPPTPVEPSSVCQHNKELIVGRLCTLLYVRFRYPHQILWMPVDKMLPEIPFCSCGGSNTTRDWTKPFASSQVAMGNTSTRRGSSTRSLLSTLDQKTSWWVSRCLEREAADKFSTHTSHSTRRLSQAQLLWKPTLLFAYTSSDNSVPIVPLIHVILWCIRAQSNMLEQVYQDVEILL